MHDDNGRNFENVLKKLKIANSVPENIERRIVKSERNNYIKLLKKTGQYSIFAAISAYAIFFFKKLGMTLTIVQGTTIVVVSSLSIAIGVSTGAYLLVEEFFKTEPVKETIIKKPIEKTVSKPEVPVKEIARPKEKLKKQIAIKKPIITIESFKSDNLDKKELKNISYKIKKSLSVLRGKKSIINYIPKDEEYVLLRGYVDYSNNQYTLDIKIYDAKKLEYVFFTTEKATGKEELNYVCDKIAHKINQKFK